MTSDVVTVAEYEGGVVILSVVRPVGDTEAEHVFQVIHNGELIAEVGTVSDAGAIVDGLTNS